MAFSVCIIVGFMASAIRPSPKLTINIVGQGSVGYNFDDFRKIMPPTCTNFTQPCEYILAEGGYVLEPTADFGWEFAGWSGDIHSSDTKNEKNGDDLLYIYIDENKIVTATFTAIDYELETDAVSPLGGTVTADPQQDFYNMGDQVELTANNNPGFIFTHWTGNFTEVIPNKSSTSMNNPILIEIQGDTQITANFAPVQHAVPISPWAIVLIMGFILSFVVYRFSMRS